MNAFKDLVEKIWQETTWKNRHKRENIIKRNMYKTGYIFIVRFCVIPIYYKMAATKSSTWDSQAKAHIPKYICCFFYISFKLSIRTALRSKVKWQRFLNVLKFPFEFKLNKSENLIVCLKAGTTLLVMSKKLTIFQQILTWDLVMELLLRLYL